MIILIHSGYVDVNATNVIGNSTEITCTIPIKGYIPGRWNVVDTAPNGRYGT
jgi:hypothetical protein